MNSNGNLQMSLPQVFAMASYSKGFACSAGPGRVLMFEKTEKNFFRESREIRVRKVGRSEIGPAGLCSLAKSSAKESNRDREG